MSINLDAIAVSHTPYYYRLATAVLIPPEISGINGLVIYIVKFSDDSDLCDPAAEPIGIRGDGTVFGMSMTLLYGMFGYG